MLLFDPASGLPAALALRMGIMAATLLAARRARRARQVAFVGAALASGVTALTAAGVLQTGRALHGAVFVHAASGFALTYTIDGLSAWFLTVLSVLAVPIAIFSTGYIGQSHFSRRSAFVGISFNLRLG